MTNHPTAEPARSDLPHDSLCVPRWWLGSPQRFVGLCQMRRRIHLHEKAAARKAVSIIGLGLLTATSVYSMDATGAVSIPSQPGFVAFFMSVALLAISAWALDRRLIQQLEDVHARSRLWLDLVDAVKEGCIDIGGLETASDREGEVERLLRREAALASRFLASGRTLALHQPIFGHCLTLEDD